MYHSLFIHSAIEEHLGYLQVLAVTYKTLVNILCSFCIDVSFKLIWVIQRSMIASSYGKSMFSFVRNY